MRATRIFATWARETAAHGLAIHALITPVASVTADVLPIACSAHARRNHTGVMSAVFGAK
jgi:hypothetical protein